MRFGAQALAAAGRAGPVLMNSPIFSRIYSELVSRITAHQVADHAFEAVEAYSCAVVAFL